MEDNASAAVISGALEDAREYVPVGLEQRHPWRCTPPQEPFQLSGALTQLTSSLTIPRFL